MGGCYECGPCYHYCRPKDTASDDLLLNEFVNTMLHQSIAVIIVEPGLFRSSNKNGGWLIRIKSGHSFPFQTKTDGRAKRM